MALENPAASRTILLIHGLWMTPRSWDHWIDRYRDRGFTVVAPAWPGMEGEVEALNRDPSPIARLDLKQVVDYYADVLRKLDEQPIIMGHSLGGTVVQLLLDRGLGAVGIGVAPATVKGIRDLPLSTIRASFPVLHNPRNRGRAVPLTESQFHYAFANTLSREESDAIYARYHVPCASMVLFQTAFASFDRNSPATVDFGRTGRPPMLLVGFADDHIVPPGVVKHNAEKYDRSVSIVDYRIFPNRPHFPGVPGWEEVADAALDWALKNVDTLA